MAINVNVNKCKKYLIITKRIIHIFRSYHIPTPFQVYQGKGVMLILPYQILTKRIIFNIIKCKNGNLHFLFSWLSSKKVYSIMRSNSCNMLFRDHKRTKLHATFLSLWFLCGPFIEWNTLLILQLFKYSDSNWYFLLSTTTNTAMNVQ